MNREVHPAVIFFGIIGLSVVAVFPISYALRDGIAVIAPSRMTWHTYPVAGQLLIDPSKRDSAGVTRALILPPGTLLSIPVLQPGVTPKRLPSATREPS